MSSKKMVVSAQEIHKRAEDALNSGKEFEFECLHDDTMCVWNPYLGYVQLIDAQTAMQMERYTPDVFYPICANDDDGNESLFSEIYDYYYNAGDENYYAVCLLRRDDDGEP